MLKIAIGYNSNVLSAGRNYNIQQSGIFPSLLYYHKSGITAGISGCWLEEADPGYTLTVTSLDYDHMVGEKLIAGVGYNHYFFHPDSNGLMSDGVNASLTYTSGWFNTSLNYGYLFGKDESGNQLVFSLGGYFSRSTQSFIDHIGFAPSVSVLLGTVNLPLRTLPLHQYNLGTGESWSSSRNRRNRNRSSPYSSSNEFGWMNTDLSLPVSFVAGNYTLGLAYCLSLPVKMASEDAAPSIAGSFTATFTYTIR